MVTIENCPQIQIQYVKNYKILWFHNFPSTPLNEAYGGQAEEEDGYMYVYCMSGDKGCWPLWGCCPKSEFLNQPFQYTGKWRNL